VPVKLLINDLLPLRNVTMVNDAVVLDWTTRTLHLRDKLHE
jgi:hypothetical protein